MTKNELRSVLIREAHMVAKGHPFHSEDLIHALRRTWAALRAEQLGLRVVAGTLETEEPK